MKNENHFSLVDASCNECLSLISGNVKTVNLENVELFKIEFENARLFLSPLPALPDLQNLPNSRVFGFVVVEPQDALPLITHIEKRSQSLNGQHEDDLF
jgi:hypothetical protein